MVSQYRRCLTCAAVAVACCILLAGCAVTPDRSGSLSGRVYAEATDQPIPGAFVESGGTITTTDETGYYALSGLTPGHRTIMVTAPGFEPYTSGVQVGEDTSYDVYMIVTIVITNLSGTVSHAALGPIEGARVQVAGHETWTDESGYYEIKYILQGMQSMSVEKPGYRSFNSPVHLNEDEQQIDITLKKYASATLHCLFDAGVRFHASFENFGADTTLLLYNKTGTSLHHKFYIRFDLDLPATADAEDAVLRLYNTWSDGVAEERTILVARVYESWDERTVTWLDAVLVDIQSIAQGTYVPRWYELDVTPYVDEWLSGGQANYGIEIDTAEEEDAAFFAFASREHRVEEWRPTISLDYVW